MKKHIFSLVAFSIILCLSLSSCKKSIPELELSSMPTLVSESFPEVSEIEPVISAEEPEPPKPVEDITEKINKSTKPTAVFLKEEVDKVQKTAENTVTVKKELIDLSKLSSRSSRLNVTYLAQKPDLPTGCEITSLTTVLNYLGFDVSKTEMADKYLPKSSESRDFWNIFVGDPRKDGFGCYAAPIVAAADKYLATQGNMHKAYNMSGSSFETLLVEVANGNPVVIWGTSYMKEPYATYKWEVDGRTLQWIAPEHCLVLIGYDVDRNVAIMSDPQVGIVEYNLVTVMQRYIALHSQAVVVRPVIPDKPEESSSEISSSTILPESSEPSGSSSDNSQSQSVSDNSNSDEASALDNENQESADSSQTQSDNSHQISSGSP